VAHPLEPVVPAPVLILNSGVHLDL